MSTNLITVTSTTRLDHAVKLMVANSISRLPVVDNGIVTSSDF